MSINDIALIREDQTQFYRANVTWLLKSAYAQCRDRQLAQDMVQETFVRLFKKWPTARTAIADRRGYAARTLLNVFRDDLRRRGTRPPMDFTADHDDRPSPSNLDDQVADVADQVRDAVRQLSPTQREVIYRFYYEGLSLAETAQVMRIGPRTVHNYHSLAKKQLQAKLAHLAPAAKERRDER